MSQLDNIISASEENWSNIDYIESLNSTEWLNQRTKKIVKTVGIYYPRLHNGGTERVTARLANIWAAMGYKVILLTDTAPHENDYALGPGINRCFLPPHNERYATRGPVLERILLEEGVDLFVSNLYYDSCTTWDLLVAKSLGIPVIIGWHSVFHGAIDTLYALNQLKFSLAGFRYADLVTTLSSMDQFWFSAQGLAARLVHNPQTFDQLPQNTASLASKTLLFLGRVEIAQKQIDQIISIMPLVLQSVPDARLIVVGDGSSRQDAADLARSLGVDKSVEFLGYKADVAPYIQASAVHVMASDFEGAPMALAEVWAYGVPTVMYNLEYLEYLSVGKGFIGVELGDTHALAAAIIKVLSDDQLRLALGREARDVAQYFFDIRIDESWRRVFQDIETCDDLCDPVPPARVHDLAVQATRQMTAKVFAVSERLASKPTLANLPPEPDSLSPHLEAGLTNPLPRARIFWRGSIIATLFGLGRLFIPAGQRQMVKRLFGLA